MRKACLILLSLIMLVASLPLFNRVEAFAEQSNGDKVETGIFLPTSYLQYYKLDNPYAICRYKDENEDFVAISHRDAIVIYKNEKFSSVPLALGNVSVKAIQRYENFLLFLYDSFIHYIDISGFEEDGWSATPVNTNIYSNTSFSVNGNQIVIHTSDYIKKYTIVTDLSGGFAVDDSTESSIHFQNSAMLLLTVDGTVYCSKIGQDGIFSWENADTPIVDASNVESLICTEDGSTVYYSCPTGVYGVNMQAQEKTPYEVVGVEDIEDDSDLGSIYTPKGICLIGDKLWIVDSSIKAVQEIDLANSNEFTDFAITTNSTAINRLSDKVKDIVVDKDRIYALDSGRIVVINDVETDQRTYNRINLSVSQIDEFSAGNGYVCYYSGGDIHLAHITQSEDDELIFDLIEEAPTRFDNVVDIAYSENAFYVITTETISNESHPVVYELDLTEDTHRFNKILSDETATGSAIEVTADVFGTVYYCTKNVNCYEFYSFDGNDVEFIASKSIDNNILNLQADFDGKLYALYEDNYIDVISNGEIASKQLETSSNLGSINPAKSMCLSCNSQTAYFIFEGLILNSSDVTDLNISTPHTIGIPSDFSTAYSSVQQFANVKDGAKLFEIDLEILDGEYFKFIDYGEVIDSQTDYAVIELNDKYSLLIKDGVSAVARNSDVINKRSVGAECLSKFAVVDFNIYSIPVLEEHFKTATAINKYDTVEIVGAITFNGINYYVVTDGVSYGYAPDTFFVESIISEDGNSGVDDVYVFKKGGVTVYDKDGNQIGVIQKKTRVTVLEKGARLTIIYGEGIGYINSDCLVSDSRAEILKAVAVILCALSVCVTSLYFEKRYLLKRR
ncbi:MAG: hypothetical protein IKA61_04890 [Clostridia bacterium]|nr:hypothetical protein [Clostridia bacterium]